MPRSASRIHRSAKRLTRWSVLLLLMLPAGAAHAAAGPDLNGLWQMQGVRFAFKITSGTSTDVRGQLYDTTYQYVDDIIDRGSVVGGSGFLAGYDSTALGYVYVGWTITSISGNAMAGFQYWSGGTLAPAPPASEGECQQAKTAQPGAGYDCRPFTAVRTNPPPGADGQATVSGSVFGTAAAPVAGVQLALSGTGDDGAAVSATQLSSSSGDFAFLVKPGTYAVRASGDPAGFISGAPVASVCDGQRSSYDRCDVGHVDAGQEKTATFQYYACAAAHPSPLAAASCGTQTTVTCVRKPAPFVQDFDCTASVGDATGPKPSRPPGGTVTFAAAPGSLGSFPAGSSCTLQPSSTSPTGTSCHVTYVGTGNPVQAGTSLAFRASYGGDEVFLPSVSAPALYPIDVEDIMKSRVDPAHAVARIRSIKGTAFVKHDGIVSLLAEGDNLGVGDEIITRRGSSVSIKLVLGGGVGVNNGATALVVDEATITGPDGKPVARSVTQMFVLLHEALTSHNHDRIDFSPNGDRIGIRG